MTYKIGVVGLGVMGANLARNIASRGFPVAGYDLNAAKTQAFAAGQAAGSSIGSADAPEKLMAVLERPRRVLMMVPAGAPVDSVIAHLRPHLEREDILIDGGNSFFRDTDRRADELASAGFRFVGMGVSGGEEGALRGPSMMPGGPREAWDALAPILRAMAAKAEDGEPCVSYMGPRGAGHYVKMVHNGIEYGDMQLIAEVYDVLSRAAGMTAREIADVFSAWNEGELRSYLVEITARVLERVDSETGKPLVDLILDEAQQKGTGKWMSQNAFDVGAPIPTVNAAVEARLLSALEIRTCRRKQGAARARSFIGSPGGQPGGRDRRDPPRAVRLEDHLVRAGDGAAAAGIARIQVRHRPRGGREDLAGRLHHSRGIVVGHSRRLQPQPRARQSDARRQLLGVSCVRTAGAARRRADSGIGGDSRPGAQFVARVLRRVPHRSPPGQSHAGPAGFLRGAYLPPRRSRRRLSHRLD